MDRYVCIGEPEAILEQAQAKSHYEQVAKGTYGYNQTILAISRWRPFFLCPLTVEDYCGSPSQRALTKAQAATQTLPEQGSTSWSGGQGPTMFIFPDSLLSGERHHLAAFCSVFSSHVPLQDTLETAQVFRRARGQVLNIYCQLTQILWLEPRLSHYWLCGLGQKLYQDNSNICFMILFQTF